jgi:hypothetical protein
MTMPSRLHTSFSDDGDDCSDIDTTWNEAGIGDEEPEKLQDSAILTLEVEAMSNVLSFLPPHESLHVLTAPICKDWQENFTYQKELWRILCLQDPFSAQMEEEEEESESDDDSSILSDDDSIVDVEDEMKRAFGSHRLMYSRLVRCQRYIRRIKEDALAGRPPSVIEYVTSDLRAASGNLQNYLARARGSSVKTPPPTNCPPSTAANRGAEPIALSDDGRTRKRPSPEEDRQQAKKLRYGASQITDRLLGPSSADQVNTALPWSCAVYSIVNWMTAFKNVQGIQSLCLDALPCLMEDEQQRLVAQRAGLADVVLGAMVRFPDSVELHTAALHSIVLLARPIGGREGQVFSMSMTNPSNMFAGHRNGIEVVLRSMKRFREHDALQAMGCWSLVNLALAPDQKALLIRLGGVSEILNAMTAHPLATEVQFRALFSLINLVIPTSNFCASWLNLVLDRMIELVVASMKNFCSNVTILNRASLVLHNLSLTQGRSRFCAVRVPRYNILLNMLSRNRLFIPLSLRQTTIRPCCLKLIASTCWSGASLATRPTTYCNSQPRPPCSACRPRSARTSTCVLALRRGKSSDGTPWKRFSFPMTSSSSATANRSLTQRTRHKRMQMSEHEHVPI